MCDDLRGTFEIYLKFVVETDGIVSYNVISLYLNLYLKF